MELGILTAINKSISFCNNLLNIMCQQPSFFASESNKTILKENLDGLIKWTNLFLQQTSDVADLTLKLGEEFKKMMDEAGIKNQ
jgi:hypothetical protein